MMQEKATELISTMSPASPISTSGAVPENSDDSSMYLCRSNCAHSPTTSNASPDNWETTPLSKIYHTGALRASEVKGSRRWER